MKTILGMAVLAVGFELLGAQAFKSLRLDGPANGNAQPFTNLSNVKSTNFTDAATGRTLLIPTNAPFSNAWPRATSASTAEWTQDGSGLNNLTGGGSGLSEAAVRKIVQTNSTSRVLNYVAQPWDVTNLVVTFIGDSHTEDSGFPWARAMMAKEQWQGATWTNAAVGATPLASVVHNANSGTNILWESLIPWVTARMSLGKTWLLINGHGTIDQISGIANVGGLEAYKRIDSNMVYICKYIIGATNGWNVVAAHPTMVMQGQNMKAASTFVTDNDRRNFNNWLVRDQYLPTGTYSITNTVGTTTNARLYDIVVDYAREYPDNNDLRYWHPDFIHLSLTNSVNRNAAFWDETVRGVHPWVPRVFGSGERDGQGWAWYPPKSGSIQTYLWEAGDGTDNTRTNRGAGGELGPGAFMKGIFSYDGTFDNQLSSSVGLEVSSGLAAIPSNNAYAAIFHARNDQTSGVVAILPGGSAPSHILYTWGPLADTAKIGHVYLNSSGEIIWRANSTGRSNDLFMASDGSMQFRNVTNNYFTMMGISESGRIYTPEALSAQSGTLRSNQYFQLGSLSGFGLENDVVIMDGTNATVTLATAVGLHGKQFTLINTNTYATNFVAPFSGQTINGLSTYTLYPGEAVNLLARNVGSVAWWYVQGSHINQNILSNILWTAIVNSTNGLSGGSGQTGMKTNQFTTNVVGQAIIGETRHSSIGAWTNGVVGVGVTNNPDGSIQASGPITAPTFAGNATTATTATTATSVDTASGGDTTSFVLIGASASGAQGVKTDSGITWNASTDQLIVGGEVNANTLTGNGALITFDNEAYDAAGWNDDFTAPTKDAVRDKIESLGLSGGAGSYMVETNFALNTSFTNTTGDLQLLCALVTDHLAAVNGQASLDLMVDQSGGVTYTPLARYGASTVVAVTLAMDYTNSVCGVVSNGAAYYWTNSSVGVGNTAVLIRGQKTILAAGGTNSVSDVAFASSWNGVTSATPSKNTVYDWAHTFDTDDDGKVNVLDMGAGLVKTDSGGVVSAASAGTDYVTPTGSGAALTVDASGFNGNLGPGDNTMQEIAQKVDDLSVSGIGGTNVDYFIGDPNKYLIRGTTNNTYWDAYSGASRVGYMDAGNVFFGGNAFVGASLNVSNQAGLMDRMALYDTSGTLVAGLAVTNYPTLTGNNIYSGSQTNAGNTRISGGWRVSGSSNVNAINWNEPSGFLITNSACTAVASGTVAAGSRFTMMVTNSVLTNWVWTLPWNAFSESQNQTVATVTIAAAAEQTFLFTYDGSIYRITTLDSPNSPPLVSAATNNLGGTSFSNLVVVTSDWIPMGAFSTNGIPNTAQYSLASAVTPTNSGDTFEFAYSASTGLTNCTRFRWGSAWDWNGGTLKAMLTTTSRYTNDTGGATKVTNCTFAIRMAAMTNGGSEDLPQWGTLVQSTNKISNTPYVSYTNITTAITVGGNPIAGCDVLIEIQRIGTNLIVGGNTTNLVALYGGIKLFYQKNTRIDFPVSTP